MHGYLVLGFCSILFTNVNFVMGLYSYLSEPGFSGLVDFQDKSLTLRSSYLKYDNYL